MTHIELYRERQVGENTLLINKAPPEGFHQLDHVVTSRNTEDKKKEEDTVHPETKEITSFPLLFSNMVPELLHKTELAFRHILCVCAGTISEIPDFNRTRILVRIFLTR